MKGGFQPSGMQVSCGVEAVRGLQPDAHGAPAAAKDLFPYVFDLIPALAYILDADGSNEVFNKPWHEYTGLTPEEACDGGWIRVFHPDDVGPALELWKELLADSKAGEVVSRLRRFDGVYRTFIIRGKPVWDENGTLIKWYGAFTDIEDQVQAKIELQKQEAALRKAEADLAHVTRVTTMGELTASIAHEVSQPLIGIVMGGNACLRWLNGDTPNLEQARESIQNVIQEGKRAGQVIERIRKLFRKDELVKEPLYLGDVIEEVLAFLRNKLQQQHVTNKLDLATDLPPVLGDRVQIQQVLMNLILNAIDAMSAADVGSRELAITTRRPSEGKVCVEVRDSGTGIAPRDQEKIFETFHTTKPGGMGMGLSICRSIVAGHGGQLELVPHGGTGAIFRFMLATR